MDVLDLYAKILMDTSEYERGLDNASSKASSFASSVGKGLQLAADGFKKIESVGQKAAEVVVGVAGGVAKATAAISSGVAVLTGAAVQNYAENEQLVGGVETLFKDSAHLVEFYASQAYQTAGLSANEYMSTVTSFSASLLQSLEGDTAKAANYADQAIIDMADNANKMGTSMEMIQNAYQGFAKQNYTMLDNLKLGYGGTKEEMQRLLKDAEKISGIKYDLSSFADITEAIHVMQEEMGIAGATAAEASSTIQGSISSMKAEWANFTVALVKGEANAGVHYERLVESIKTVGDNLIPRVEQTVDHIIGIAPEAVDAFLELAPRFLEAGGNIVRSVAEGISEKMPELLQFGSQLIGNLAMGIMEALPAVFGGIEETITGVINMFGENSEQLQKAGNRIMNFVIGGFENIIDAALPLISDFASLLLKGVAYYHEDLFNAGLNIITALLEGLAGDGGNLYTTASEILGDIVYGLTSNVDKITTAAISIVETLVQVVSDKKDIVIQAAFAVITTLATGLLQMLPDIVKLGLELIVSLANGIAQSLPELIPTIVDVVLEIVDVLTNPDSIGQLVDAALAIIIALADGLIEAIPELVEAIPEIIINIVDALVENVPKILETGVTLLLALAEGLIKAIPDLVKEIPRVITAVVDGFKRYYSKLWDIGKDMVRGIWEGIQSMASWISNKVGGFFDDLFGGVKEHEQIHSPSKRWEPLGKFMAQGIGVGWDKEFSHIQDGINKSLDFGSASIALSTSTGGAASDGSFGGTTFSGLTININGANYSDENALAEAIALRLQRMTERRAAVYA